jgi:uncharacterized membrane protein YfcA
MTDDLLFVIIVVGVTAFIQAITGFGFALLAVPLLALRVSVHEAVVLSACMGTLSSGWQSINLRQYADPLLTRRYLVASINGIPLGYAAFVFLSDQLLRIVVGVSVLGGTAIVATMRERNLGLATQRALGVASGALLIATSTNGPPIVLALQAQGMPKQEFRGTLARIFFVSGVISVVVFAFAGSLDSAVVVTALFALPALVAAVWLGNRMAVRVRDETFRQAVLLLLVLAGVSSVAAALS